jgi:glycolate oxidase iron-sulfur subunit
LLASAIDYHLDARTAGLTHARRNIDAWWPVQNGAEAIVQTAGGGVMELCAHAVSRSPARLPRGDADSRAPGQNDV